MGVTTTKTNKPLNPRGNDQSPLAFNRAKLYSGKALDFDGVNDVVNITTDDVDLQEFSVVQYVNLGATAASKIFYSNYAPTGNLGFATGISDSTANVPKFYTKGTSSDTLFGSFALNAGEWYQIVATYDGATKKIYVNGVLDTSVAFSDTILYTNATNQIGALSGSTAQALDGQLSNTKIFNTALTAAQVADLYNNPEKVVPTGVDNTALKLWLPMMEGAGTTAYDGSGNGNHGTISGATYVNGVGAPVAQSAVMDWNKGSNYAVYSEEFENADWSKFTGASVDSNETTAPDGKTTADKVSFSASVSSRISDTYTTSTSNNKTHTISVWAKVASGTEQFRLKCTHGGIADYFSSDLTATTEWQRFTFSQAFGTTAGTGVIYAIQNATDGAAREIFFWGFQLNFDSSTAGPYVRTGATAQPTPVLLPQGLTSGRDITGVNLFENVRKQGALNLDGNSWAEVHDNASLDITTAITLEAWVQIKDGMVADGVLGRWSSSLGYLLYLNASNDIRFYVNGLDTRYTSLTNGWRHIVGLYDGSAKKLYVDGVQVSSSSQSVGAAASTAPIEIGRYQQSTGNTFDGPIAHPRIYNRALTAEEVQRNYNAGKNTYTN